MRFIPYEDFTYDTELSENEILKRLNDVIGQDRMFHLNLSGDGKERLYEGKIIDRQFDVKRVGQFSRNSIQPNISGFVYEEDQRTHINLNIFPNFVVVIYFFIVFGILMTCLISTLIKINNDSFDFWQFLVLISLTLSLYAIALGAFKYVARKIRREFAEIFECKIELTSKFFLFD